MWALGPIILLSIARLLTVNTLVRPCIATAGVMRDDAITYDGTAVLRIPTGHNTSALGALIGDMGLRTWTHSLRPKSHVDVEVPQDVYERFLIAVRRVLDTDGVTQSVVVMHADLGASIREEAGSVVKAKELAVQAEKLASQDWFNSYHSYDDHLVWLDDLVAAFPNNSKIITSGKSVEGRDIKGINIFGSSGPGAQPAVIWHGTVHAREWITTMTVEYLAYSLLNNYANSTEVRGYVDKYDFYIFPVVNPDGFVFTQSSDRMWRKNRQTTTGSPSACVGRDLNRNWNISWSEPPEAASADPCDDNYRGNTPADSPEITGLSAFLNARAASPPGAAMFVDWHSYGQLFMFPYGYDCEKKAVDNDELGRLASGFSAAVQGAHGANYTTGPICTTIYATSGSSTDYAYDVSKIKYSFAAELRDSGEMGFVLPTDQIRVSGEETWEGVKYLLANMVTKRNVPSSAMSLHARMGTFLGFGAMYYLSAMVLIVCMYV